MKKKQWFITSVLAISVVLIIVPFGNSPDGNARPRRHERKMMVVDGLPREYLMYVPAKKTNPTPRPLVIMLHGMGGTARRIMIMRETDWSSKADQQNIVVVYPEATRPDAQKFPNLRTNPQAWNDGSGRFHAAAKRVDDVAYIEAIIDELTSTQLVDERRIFIAGFSNGGAMAFRAGEELSHLVKAIAVSGSTFWNDDLELERGVSLLYMTGLVDTLNPYAGGLLRTRYGKPNKSLPPKRPVEESIALWTSAVGTPSAPIKQTNVDGVSIREFSPGRNNAIIKAILIEDLGHHWPGGKSLVPKFLVGKNSDKVNATDASWDFFDSLATE